jgi:TetR/AcrR family transcriptional regulator, lmrAB and yxaGH operons repressor
MHGQHFGFDTLTKAKNCVLLFLMTDTTTKSRPNSSANLTRARLLRAAIDLFQARGYHAVGISEILAKANAPKGVLYYHFPGGKDELGAAAVEMISRQVDARLEADRAAEKAIAQTLRGIAQESGKWLEAGGFVRGPLLSVIAQVSVEDAPLTANATRQAYSRWVQHIFQQLEAEGAPTSTARPLSELALSALEGGMTLARARRTRAPLEQAVDTAGRLIEAAVSRPNRAR